MYFGPTLRDGWYYLEDVCISEVAVVPWHSLGITIAALFSTISFGTSFINCCIEPLFRNPNKKLGKESTIIWVLFDTTVNLHQTENKYYLTKPETYKQISTDHD